MAEIDKSLKKIDYTFRWTGMNLESSRKSRSENLKYKFIYFFNFFWLNTDVAGAVCWFIDSAMKGASFTTLTYVAPCITMCFLANIKSISILVYKRHINKIISILRTLETEHSNRDHIFERQEIINKESRFLFFVLKSMNVLNWTLTIAFPLMPLSLTAIEYYNSGRIELNLPFHVLYPFDAFDIRYWPWIYLRQSWETVIVVIEMSGVDYLFYVCVAFICIQFKLLQYDLRMLITSNKCTKKSHKDAEFHNRLVEIVKWHQELIGAVQLLEHIYAKSTLFNVVSSSFLICLSGFNVLTIDDKPYIVSFASFLFASLLQIFTLCYFGDMLMKSSIAVSDSVYESLWYANPAVAKDLKIIHMRGQKPCRLTAYGFADVNLKAFTKILSTSWSYFALLRTVYSSPHL